MGFGRLNIWLRDINCNPKLAFNMHLSIKTCCGANLLDFSPEIIEILHKEHPEWKITKEAEWDGEKGLIRIDREKGPPIKHIEIPVPPNCYIVRAWVCADNLWSDRQMVIVNCGEMACVNLIVPPKEKCMKEAIAPLIVAAREQRIPQARVNAAVDALVRTAGVKKAELTKDLTNITRVVKASKETEAPKYAAAFELLSKQVRRMR